MDPELDMGEPGEFPFLRGPFSGGYTTRPWRTLQYAGYGAGEDTNARWKFLLSQGQKGLNLAFHLPTQVGLDSDDPRCHGEVGRIGVAIDTLADMEALYDGIDVGEISSAYTINATANIILAMYIALAKKQGVPQENLSGTLQNDILKEYTSRGTYIYPPGPSIKMVGDIIEYCARHMPRMNAVNVSCHMLGAGATHVQTWALMFATAAVYIEETLKRGLAVDGILSHITFLTNVDMNFLRSIASHRAARRLWARIARDRFGAQDQRSMRMRMGTGIHALSLVDKQPLNNIARIAIMAMAAAFAGPQSMHLASYDESYAIPSEEATRISLMIQHILIHETDICATADPLGGSFAIESLTNQAEEAIKEAMADIEGQGGIAKMIENGVIQRQLAFQAFNEQKSIETGEKVVIGVNKYVIHEKRERYESGMFELDPKVSENQIKRLNQIKATRDNKAVMTSLEDLEIAAKGDKNLIPYLIPAVESYCTVGEICNVLRNVYGEYRETGNI
jgi:methylmalonyl-CoA mutase N-terminal domain/subunit